VQLVLMRRRAVEVDQSSRDLHTRLGWRSTGQRGRRSDGDRVAAVGRTVRHGSACLAPWQLAMLPLPAAG
jgi:hypothetical protein